MDEYKNQHYVPAFYLRGFIDNKNIPEGYDKNSLWTLNIETNEIKLKGINNICSENYFYSYLINEYNYNHDVEKKFQMLENEFALFVKKVLKNFNNIRNRKPPENFNSYEEDLVYTFFLFQLLRVPKIVNELKSHLITVFQQFNKDAGVEQTIDEIENDVKKFTFPKMFDVKSYSHQNMVNVIKIKNWQITFIDENIDAFFITSDNPLLVVNPYERNALISPTTELSLPLTKCIALSLGGISRQKDVVYKIFSSKEDVLKINKALKNNSTKYAFSGDKKMLEDCIIE